MIKINVIDFDKTLIPFDSFRIYVKLGIKKLNIRTIFFSLLRMFRIINNETFKKKIMGLNIINKKEIESFKSFLLMSIDNIVLEKIKEHTTNTTINILCSASPDFYVSAIAKELNMIGYGSFFNAKKEFFHMYGKKKVEYILKNYPKRQYHYNYSISDSNTDILLLSLFEESELFMPNSYRIY